MSAVSLYLSCWVLMTPELRAKCRLCGFELQYQDLWGGVTKLTESEAKEMLSARGCLEKTIPEMLKERRKPVPVCEVVYEDQVEFSMVVHISNFSLRVSYEDGHEEEPEYQLSKVNSDKFLLSVMSSLPIGYHKLLFTSGGSKFSTHLLCSPRGCYQPLKEKVWGVSSQLYSLRGSGPSLIGDFAALSELCKNVSQMGGALVGINPIHASLPFSESPYSPSSRVFLNYIYCSFPSETDGGAEVNYREVYENKISNLKEEFTSFEGSTEFESFRARMGPELRAFAEFSDAENPELHEFVQWRTHKELRSVVDESPLALGLYLDIAVGVPADSADVSLFSEVFCDELRVGAPPDEYNKSGQDWGFVCLDPDALRETGYKYFKRVLASSMQYSAVVRIDHAMAMRRVFCKAGDSGAYLKFNEKEMLAVLSIESVRHKCIVIGEDLGTVPAGFRETMERNNIFSYRVMLFERGENASFNSPKDYPELSLATATTHDLPPLASWWAAEDIRVKNEIGLIEDIEDSYSWRRWEKQCLLHALDKAKLEPRLPPDSPFDRETVVKVNCFLAQSRSLIRIMSIEDLSLETRLINIPGITDGYRCWILRNHYRFSEFDVILSGHEHS